MKHTQKVLMTLFLLFIAATLIVVIVFESNLLPTGLLITEDKTAEFVIATIFEIATLILIPTALRLFKIHAVEHRITTPEALLRWGLIRLLMLCVPMLLNALFYYLYLNVAFGYLGIILMLCLFFIVPTKGRCLSEIYKDNQTNE